MSSKGNPKDGDDADHDYFFRHAHDYDYGDELGGNEYSDEDDSDADDGTFRRPLTVADSTDTDSGGSVAVLEETSDSNVARKPVRYGNTNDGSNIESHVPSFSNQQRRASSHRQFASTSFSTSYPEEYSTPTTTTSGPHVAVTKSAKEKVPRKRKSDWMCLATVESRDTRKRGGGPVTYTEKQVINQFNSLDGNQYYIPGGRSPTNGSCVDRRNCKSDGCLVQVKIERGDGTLSRLQRGVHNHASPVIVRRPPHRRSDSSLPPRAHRPNERATAPRSGTQASRPHHLAQLSLGNNAPPDGSRHRYDSGTAAVQRPEARPNSQQAAARGSQSPFLGQAHQAMNHLSDRQRQHDVARRVFDMIAELGIPPEDMGIQNEDIARSLEAYANSLEAYNRRKGFNREMTFVPITIRRAAASVRAANYRINRYHALVHFGGPFRIHWVGKDTAQLILSFFQNGQSIPQDFTMHLRKNTKRKRGSGG